MDITLSPLGTQLTPARVSTTPAHVSTASSPIPLREPTTPACVSTASSPRPFPFGEPSTPARVSAGVSPIPFEEPSIPGPTYVSTAVSPIPLIHLMPPDLAADLAALLESQEEPDILTATTPPLPARVIVPDQEWEGKEEPGASKAAIPLRGPSSPEIISETEPESD